MGLGTLWWMVSFATSAAGGLLAAGSTRLLGRVRAATHWPTAPPTRRGSRAAALTGILLGLALLAAGVAGAVLRLAHPGTMLGFSAPAGAAAAVALLGGLAVAKLAERAELTALIRTSPATPGAAGRLRTGPGGGVREWAGPARPGEGDPAVPAGGRPGWVYRDAGGDWYLAIAADDPRGAGVVPAGAGQRLVRLPEFALVPPGSLAAPLELAGSVQISVYPVEEQPRSAHLS